MTDDLISRQAAIDALSEMYCKSDEDGYVWLIRGDACLRIDALPSVDAVEVVRCNQCQHYQGNHDVPGCAPCDFWGIGAVMWDDYCKRGERYDSD